MGISNVVQQIEQHGLKNFANLEEAVVLETDSFAKWQPVDGKLVIKHTEELSEIVSTGVMTLQHLI